MKYRAPCGDKRFLLLFAADKKKTTFDRYAKYELLPDIHSGAPGIKLVFISMHWLTVFYLFSERLYVEVRKKSRESRQVLLSVLRGLGGRKNPAAAPSQ